MQIQFQQDYKDIIAFQLNVIHHSYTHHIKRNYFRGVTSVLLFVLLLVILHTSIIMVLLDVIITMGYYFMSAKLYTIMQLTGLKKKMGKHNYSPIIGLCIMNINDTGITREINNEKKSFAWAKFERLTEDDNHFFLYVNDLQGLIIAKNADYLYKEHDEDYQRFIKQQAKNFTSNHEQYLKGD